MSKAKHLRRLLEGPEIIIAPGATDAFIAKIIESLGFKAIYVTGAGVANTLGFPDIGLTTMNEVVDRAKIIARAVDVPVISDADTGYGNAINVMRTVREFIDAGVAAIHIEDQVMPKRCGHFEGKSVISKEEMVGKIRAAVEARGDDDLVIIARTDARDVYGIDDAIERGNLYAKAGADMIFVESPRSIDELKRIASEVKAPLLVNMVEGGKTPLIPASDLEKMGFKVVIYPNTALRAAGYAVREALRVLRDEGVTTSILNRLLSWDERQNLVRLPYYRELERKYLSVESK
ncbi:MAG: oxaloacetate decarboxylase [Nitrososphaerales archaeon]|nr:oxaloacetate decarboxylase [Nitrososphaerales archaeon]